MRIFYIGFDSDDGPGLRRDAQISADDVNRVVRAYGKLYFPNGVTEDEGESATIREPTGSEVFEALAKGLLEGILANVVSVEKAEAKQAAEEAVAPIVVQPVG